MNKSFKLKTSMLAIATLVMVLVSCSDGDEGKSPTVEIPPLKVTPAKLTLILGEKGIVGANIAPVTYSSSATSTVTVDASTGEVEALALGDAVITAMTSSGETASSTVTVVPIALKGFTVTPIVVRLRPDSTAQITATPEPENATYFNLVWSSSNESVATVSQTGLITAVGFGTATVTAAVGDIEKTVTVNVPPMEGADFFKIATGYWQFEDANDLGKATRGNDLAIIGTVTQVDGPSADNKAVQGTKGVADLTFSLEREEDTKAYTIMWDVQIPAIRQYYSVLWYEGLGDAAWFLRWRDDELQGGIGSYSRIVGYTAQEQAPWLRIILVVYPNPTDAPVAYSAYVNGRPFDEGRLRGDENLFWRKDKPMYFMADNPGDSEDNEHPTAAIAVWDRALTPEQIAAIGGVGVY